MWMRCTRLSWNSDCVELSVWFYASVSFNVWICVLFGYNGSALVLNSSCGSVLVFTSVYLCCSYFSGHNYVVALLVCVDLCCIQFSISACPCVNLCFWMCVVLNSQRGFSVTVTVAQRLCFSRLHKFWFPWSRHVSLWLRSVSLNFP
jgi:hypothetical protein